MFGHNVLLTCSSLSHTSLSRGETASLKKSTFFLINFIPDQFSLSFISSSNLCTPPVLHCKAHRGTISILPSPQMDDQAVLGRLNKLVWIRHKGVSARLCRISIRKNALVSKQRTWWSGHQCSLVTPKPRLGTVRVQHLNDNLVLCFVGEVRYCQAVVGSFRFLKEEQLV